MDLSGLLLSLLLVQTTPSLAAPRDYRLVSLKKTWSEAQSYCREWYTDLATVESFEDVMRVKTMMDNSGDDEVWIGLYDDVRSWKWSMDGSYLYKDGISAFEGWTDFNEDSVGGLQRCAVVNSRDGTVSDEFCSGLKNSVCFDELSNTFIPVTEQMNWLSAQSYCREKYRDLASMRTQQEMEEMLSVLPEGDSWWIGLSREGWTWSDQSHCSYRFWFTFEPNGLQNCVIAGLRGWLDVECHRRLPFVCSDLPKKVVKVMLKTDGSVNLNDPRVKETLLQQMEIHLREQGIEQHLRLRWRKPPNERVFNQIHTGK